jgi:hypothetical protein
MVKKTPVKPSRKPVRHYPTQWSINHDNWRKDWREGIYFTISETPAFRQLLTLFQGEAHRSLEFTSTHAARDFADSVIGLIDLPNSAMG